MPTIAPLWFVFMKQDLTMCMQDKGISSSTALSYLSLPAPGPCMVAGASAQTLMVIQPFTN